MHFKQLETAKKCKGVNTVEKYIDFQDVMNTIAKEYFDFMRGAEDISMDGFQLDDDSISNFYVWSQRFEQMSNAFDKLCCYDVYIFYCTSDSFGAVPIRDGEIIDNDKINIPNYFNLSNSLEDDSIFFEISFNESENVYNLKDVSREEVENILNKTITKAYVMEESKMNMYDEMLNKYAQFLGYDGKIKADETYLLSERDKLEKIIMLADTLSDIKFDSYNCNYGKAFLACYNEGSAHKIEGENVKGQDVNWIIFSNLYNDATPCICFVIDANKNIYKEISIGVAMQLIAEQDLS